MRRQQLHTGGVIGGEVSDSGWMAMTWTFSGGTVDAYASIPTDSGGEESRISASYGRDLSRGNFRVTADYSKKTELQRGQRDYFTCGNQYIFDQATGDRADIVDPRTGQRACEDLTWGHVWIYDYADPTNIPSSASLLSQFDYDGDLGANTPPYPPATTPGMLTHPAGFFPVGRKITDFDVFHGFRH